MNYILNIETSTKNCSVAVAKNGKTIICKEFADTNFSHAEKLHVFIEDALSSSSISIKDLAAIAISQGPGSYTGLRIGVSTAKGLCYSLDIPLISTDTLQVLANQVHIDNGVIVPMLDARRMEVYCAVYNKEFIKIKPIEALIIDANSFDELNSDVCIVGDCIEKVKNVLTNKKFKFIDTVVYPSAKEMSGLSFEKFQKQEFENLAYFEPLYLKDFLATTKKKLE